MVLLPNRWLRCILLKKERENVCISELSVMLKKKVLPFCDIFAHVWHRPNTLSNFSGNKSVGSVCLSMLTPSVIFFCAAVPVVVHPITQKCVLLNIIKYLTALELISGTCKSFNRIHSCTF